MSETKRKSVWKSRSFIGGLVGLVVIIALGYGVPIPAGLEIKIIEGVFGLISLMSIGKSVAKRM